MYVGADSSPVSLITGKVYQVIRPLPNDGHRVLRVIDEEGEDYLYSKDQFVEVELPPRARRAVARAAELVS